MSTSLPPVLVSHSITVQPGHTVISLVFNEAIQLGTGTVIVTDGALQTVIDRSGMPSTRVVGATETHQISLSSVSVSGNTALISADNLTAGHDYRVFILPNVLQSGDGLAFAGISNGNLLTFNAGAAADTAAPTVSSFTLSGNKVSHSGTVDVTVTFSEKIKALAGTAFDVPNASVSSTFTTTDGGTTWHGTLSTNASTNAVGNVLKLDLSKVQDLAGNAGSGFTQANTAYDVDVTPPTVTMSLSDTHLSSTQGATLTMQFSEAVATPSLSWLTAPNATLSNLTKVSTDGSVWSATLLASGTATSTNNQVTLDMSHVVDLAGNAGTGSSTSPSYDVNGTVSSSLPYVSYIYLGNDSAGYASYDSDHGTYSAYDPTRATDFITSDAGVSIHGTLSSALSSGQSLQLTIGTQQVTVTTNGQTWDYYLPTTAPTLAPGSYTVTAKVVDGTSTGTTMTKTLVVDTTAPTVTSGTTGLTQDVGTDLVVQFSEQVVWQGIANFVTSGSETYVSFKDEDNYAKLVHDGITEYVYIDQNNLSSDGKTLTIKANSLHLTSGASYSLDLAPSPGHDVSSLTDVAGNFLSPHVISFTTTGSTTDTTAPQVMAAMATNQGDFKIGDTVQIQVKFSEPVKDGGTHAELTLNNGAKAVFDHFSSDGRTAFFNYTVTAGDTTPPGNLLDLNGMGTLATTITDMAGNHLSTSSVQLTSLLTKYAYSDVLVDPVQPATITAAPVLDDAADTGVKGDSLTTMGYPSFHGSGATPGTMVVLYEVGDGQRMVGYATADSSGNYQISLNSDGSLSQGTHHLKVGQLSAVLHNPSAGLSASLDLTVDGIAPSNLIASLDAGSDGGTLGDWKTAVTTPKLVFANYESGATVTIMDGTTSLGNLSVGSDGSVTLPTLATGVHHLSFTQTDAAGNPSGTSTVDLTIDPTAILMTPLSKLASPLLSSASDSGSSSTDGITSVTKPVFTGTAATAGATIQLFDGSTSVGTTTADGQGAWSITLTTALTEGAHSFTVKQSDSTHSASTASDAVSVTVDLTTPSALAKPVLATASDNGVSSTDGVTSIQTPVFTGSGAEPSATIKLYSDGVKVGEGTVQSNGTWSITSDNIATQGIHQITATQTDLAGHVSAASTAFELDIVYSAPSLTSSPSYVNTGASYIIKFSDLLQIANSIGEVDVFKGSDTTPLLRINATDSQWTTETSGFLKYNILKLDGLADGDYTLHFTYTTPVNLVGIAATTPLSDIHFHVGTPA
jgi:hypothetical protein